MARLRSKPYRDFGPQPAFYVTPGVARPPLLYQAVADHRGYGEKRSWGLFRVADYPDAEAALAAAVDVLDARRPNGEIHYYVETIYEEG